MKYVPGKSAERLLNFIETHGEYPAGVVRALRAIFRFINNLIAEEMDRLARRTTMQYVNMAVVHPAHVLKALRQWPWTPIPLRPPETRT
ncbi:MAG: hypothetical protein RLZZ342_772, partial [Candidatus Parcubacteria bacterium]